jgi:mRNA-degrading endonuclease RelE of RelBE toxin-antitoxin system
MQINLTSVASNDLSSLPKLLQLQILADFKNIPADLENIKSEKIGCLRRDGKTMYRFRANDYRIYFSPTPQGLLIHRVLHKNTLDDFLYRSNLPLGEEDSTLAGNKNFWKLLEPDEDENPNSSSGKR